VVLSIQSAYQRPRSLLLTPSAVLLSPDQLESMEATMEILQDKKLLTSILRSRREAAGKRLRFKRRR
jgi:PHD/YefM family antitoxin component YafN of YafNO toxin-antitoxin module